VRRRDPAGKVMSADGHLQYKVFLDRFKSNRKMGEKVRKEIEKEPKSTKNGLQLAGMLCRMQFEMLSWPPFGFISNLSHYIYYIYNINQK
jgi:hypothetical protein